MMLTDHIFAHDADAANSPFGSLINRLTQVDFANTEASTIASILRETHSDATSLSRFANFVPDRYARNGVYRNDCFELVVMCWPANVRSAIHEHGGSRGFVRVERGSLLAENYTIVESDPQTGFARLALDAKRTLTTGEVEIVVPGNDVHRVGAAGGKTAISLHLYARPLDTFFVFDEQQHTIRSCTSQYDMRPAGPMLAPDARPREKMKTPIVSAKSRRPA